MRRMMFWLLALVLLASLAGVGYRQGAIRVAFSFVGILIGALLAGPLGKLVKPLLVVLGLKTPPLAWWLAPLIVFVVISIIFKVGALVVHKKVDVHFRYHAGDLRQVSHPAFVRDLPAQLLDGADGDGGQRREGRQGP